MALDWRRDTWSDGRSRQSPFNILLVFPFVYVIAFVTVEMLPFVWIAFLSMFVTHPLTTVFIISWSSTLLLEILNVLNDFRSPLVAVYNMYSEKLQERLAKHLTVVEVRTDNGKLRLPEFCLDLRKATDWKQFLDESRMIYLRVCGQIIECQSPDTFNARWEGRLAVERVSVESNRFVSSWLWRQLDLRPDRQNVTYIECLQHALWIRLCGALVKIALMSMSFLVVPLFLISSDRLWNLNLGPANVDVVVFTLAAVPLFSYFREKIASPPLTGHQEAIVDKLLEEELESAFNKAKKQQVPPVGLCILLITPTNSIIARILRLKEDIKLKFKQVQR